MHVLLAAGTEPAELELWRRELAAAAPELHWHLAGEAFDAAAIEAAVVGRAAPGLLRGLPNLRLVQSLWAGIDRLLADPTLPEGVPIARMVDPAMNAAMAETALWAVLSLHRGFFQYARQQRQRQWVVHAQRRADEVGVLVLGRGQMGGTAAERLRAQGYRVAAWGRDAPLQPLLARHEIVVNLLPLTPATRGLLDARLFAALPRGAGVVNLARGAHLVDADLLEALQCGQLSHAVLDVFHQEPLPEPHPFWDHPQVTVLPHAAAQTDARSAAAVVAANLRALRDGRPLHHLVERTRGY